MAKPIRVLYFVPYKRASRDRVIQSQTFGQARMLTRTGEFECMVITADAGEGVQTVRELPALQDVNRVYVSSHYPEHPNYYRMVSAGKRALREARGVIRDWGPNFIYVRESQGVAAVQPVVKELGCRCVFDLRGLSGDEVYLRRKCRSLPIRLTAPIAKKLMDARIVRAVRRADRLVTVSSYLADWIRREAGRADVLRIPCCVDIDEFVSTHNARSRLRASLGWSSGDRVVVYSGGASAWQRLEDILWLLEVVMQYVQNLKVLVLTQEPNQVRQMAMRTGIPNSAMAVLQAAHKDVPDWLAVADAGIIFRHNTALNNAASPVKISEYLAAGLPVICTAGIGDLSEVIAERQVGLVLNSVTRESALSVARFLEANGNADIIKRRARETASETLSFQAHLNTYRRLFSA